MTKKSLFSSIMDMPYGRIPPYHFINASKNSRELVQKLTLQRKIPVHDGCVNSICWNDSGKYLLSGSDDQRLSIVNGYDYSVRLFFIQLFKFI
ncbi:DDB1-and CUL4-associated factor 6 [Nephila pilipes]|uniref:DDB1-and CUL4-associated factor 6 n=1 Tax=Nephila pilipes TaxID=299642 RepID=A0A8X6U5D2_NEPPI|nr:DDB1-and CUL4-associated factor 6 [Nephila pilipes]